MKRGMILVFTLVVSLIIFSPLILATEEEHVEAAYQCLMDEVDDRGCSDLSVSEQAITLLSISDCFTELNDSMKSTNCWGDGSSCSIKETAQAAFSLYEKRVDTTGAEEWLLAQTMEDTSLDWFLEIDMDTDEHPEATCYVSYGTPEATHTITFDEDKKITGGPFGTCLTTTPNSPYWFTISHNCYNQEFDVKCDEPFLTTLLFKDGSGPLNVLDTTQIRSAKGRTKEQVSARCFGTGSACDYEDTLWAAFSLWALGHEQEVKLYLPYLMAAKDSNQDLLPEAFLHFMTGDYSEQLSSEQRFAGMSHWQVSNNPYYDTALGLWALRAERDDWPSVYGKEWILNNQGDSGCWGGDDLVSTSIIVRALWPEDAPECRFDGDCASPKICNETIMECVDPPECTTNTDCTSPEICNVTSMTCYNPIGDLEGCQSDEECEDAYGDGYVCDSDGECYDEEEVECGNDLKEGGEQCDGTDLNSQTCNSIMDSGIWTGDLSCEDDCDFDSTDCEREPECTSDGQCDSPKVCNDEGFCVNPDEVNYCGDNAIGDGEACDGYDFNGKTCSSMLGLSGNLHCVAAGETDECTIDTSDCEDTPPECTSDWQCDSPKVCNDEGFCVNSDEVNYCGDNAIGDGEACDGYDFNGKTCSSMLGLSGNLHCVASGEIDECTIDTSDCEDTPPECTLNWDCPIGQECVSGNCLVVEDNDTDTDPETCETNFDCSNYEQICVEGICSDNEIYDCEDAGYFCMPNTQCTGSILSVYTGSCEFPFKCCDTPLPLESCFEQGGEICLDDEICSGGVDADALDISSGETCCTGGGYCVKTAERDCGIDDDCYSSEVCVDGLCELEADGGGCEDSGGTCRINECGEDEETEYLYDCPYGDICCVDGKKKKGSGAGLIIILLVLILLVVAGIIFRDKVKVYWLKVKSKFEKGGKKPRHGGRPGMEPSGARGKKESFLDKIKGIFKGKKSKRAPNVPQRPLRGPLAIQHAQRQAQAQQQQIRPLPNRSTSTAFTPKGPPSNVVRKKPAKKSGAELDDVLNKLKKMGK